MDGSVTLYYRIWKCSTTDTKVAISAARDSLVLWLYLCRARSKITQLLTPTHAQLQRHRLKFIKKPFKKLLHGSVSDHLQGVTISSLKPLLFKHSCMYTRCGGVAAYHVVCIGLCLWSVRVCVFLPVLWTSTSINRYKQHNMLPHHSTWYTYNCV